MERQAARVAALSRELRFELLLLRRMRERAAERAPPEGQAAPRAFGSLAEVYAAALARSVEAAEG
ncbi:hypothetical protein D3218_09085 [Aureimonas flava]|uniref:Uncharacterized protein n=2 Tax=Aureimonas flava TaxID=2320271 RepID=A0A3A1WU73_9HYPH|nr:hypothetical protein D3218_09085 [Aureimonas flava]